MGRAAVAEGRDVLERALRLRRPGPTSCRPAIAGAARRAPTWGGDRLARRSSALYDGADRRRRHPWWTSTGPWPSALAEGPCAGLAVLEAAAADPRAAAPTSPCTPRAPSSCVRAGDAGGADAAYARAIALSANAVERAELERRRLALLA